MRKLSIRTVITFRKPISLHTLWLKSGFTMMFLFYVTVSFMIASFANGRCPNSEDIYPCTCHLDSLERNNINCVKIESVNVLERAVARLEGKEISLFKIMNSTMTYLPQSIFKGMSIEELELENTALMSLSNTDVALEGLEKSLIILTINNCVFMNGWDWAHLKNLKELIRIDIISGDMTAIGEEINQVGHLPIVDLAFSRNAISWIDDIAFSSYKEMLSLSLNQNQVSELKRSMFPNPAPALHLLDFSDNELRSFPENLFTNMPSLSVLDLNKNKIVTLDEGVFSRIWEQLQIFGTLFNPFRCDCRITWLTKKKHNHEAMRAVCTAPDNLVGRMLNTLSAKDLYC